MISSEHQQSEETFQDKDTLYTCRWLVIEGKAVREVLIH